MEPNFYLEQKLQREGYCFVLGLDEVGRGALAGPVTAAGVILLPDFFKKRPPSWIKLVRDSKKLSVKQREFLYEKAIGQTDLLCWASSSIGEKVIDKENILQATKLAMEAVVRKIVLPASILILDGNFSISSDIPQKSIIGADNKVFSVALASIVAKVTRDRLMISYHSRYPRYGFAQHKGYGTKQHLAMLKKHGSVGIHRRSFRGVKPS